MIGYTSSCQPNQREISSSPELDLRGQDIVAIGCSILMGTALQNIDRYTINEALEAVISAARKKLFDLRPEDEKISSKARYLIESYIDQMIVWDGKIVDMNPQLEYAKIAKAAYEGRTKDVPGEHRVHVREYTRKRKLCHVNSKRNETYRKLGRDIYNKILIQGRPVGDIFYNELSDMRFSLAFETHLCELLLRHGTPADNIQIKDFISPENLLNLVYRASLRADQE